MSETWNSGQGGRPEQGPGQGGQPPQYPGQPYPGQPGYPGSGSYPGYDPSATPYTSPGTPYPPVDPNSDTSTFPAIQYGPPPAGYGVAEPGYPGATQGYGGWQPPPAPPSNKRRNILISVAVAVVLIAGGTTAAVLASGGSGKPSAHGSGSNAPSTPTQSAPTGSTAPTGTTAPTDTSAPTGDTTPGTLTVPQTVGQYRRLQNSTSERLESTLRTLLKTMSTTTGSDDIVTNSAIGVYGNGSSDVPAMYFFAFPTDSLASTEDAKGRVDLLLQGAAGDNKITSYPTGSSDAALECAPATYGAQSISLCAWSDDTSSGASYKLNPAGTPAALATTTNQLRKQVDG